MVNNYTVNDLVLTELPRTAGRLESWQIWWTKTASAFTRGIIQYRRRQVCISPDV